MGGVGSTGKATLAPEMKRYFNFSRGQIARLKERLELVTDDFGIDKAQLMEFFKCSDKEADTIFKIFDIDENGRIDSYEFLCGMALVSQSSLEEKAELIFGLYDFDGNRYITRDELVIMMTNSFLSKEPQPTIEEIEKKTDEVMKSADVNNDKRISLTEFISYTTKNKEILSMLNYYGVITKDDLREDFGGNENESEMPDCDSDLENEVNTDQWDRDEKTELVKKGIEFANASTENGYYLEEEVEQATEFAAVKPWLGVVKNSVPTTYKPQRGDSDAPDATLELDYVHGYRCEDARNNLRYTRTGKAVYHTAAVGVVLDTMENTQKHFLEHTDDIICLAIHPGLAYVATGEIGPNPLICVWDTSTMECLARISGTLKKGICQLAFSNDGKYLAASAADDYHCIAIYEWEKCTSTAKHTKGGSRAGLVATGQVTRANILSLTFNPTNTIVAAPGIKEVNFVSFAGGVVKVRKGINWGTNRRQAVLCAAYLGNNLVTGTFSGQLFIWKENSLSNVVSAHKGSVNCIWPREGKKGIVTGGNDGLVIVWDAGLKRQAEINLVGNKLLNCLMPRVRSVCESMEGNLLVGMRSGEIIEIKQDKPKVVLRSHFKDELWGLAIHPRRPEFATLGQDAVFAIWDIITRKQKQFAKIDCEGDVVEFSPDGAYLALGLINGQVIVLDAEKYTTVATRKDRSSPISEIKFAPDCSTMCVGAHDGFILAYDVASKFKSFKRLRGHHSKITHIDYSENSRAIQSNSSSYEILYFDLTTGKHMPSGATVFRDEKWATWTCTFGWPVQGIWPPCSDGSDINALDRSIDRTVAATGDDFGKVKLFRYPCPVERSSFQVFRGHSSHVTNVRFTADGNYLISTGGHDKSVFQWKYMNDSAGREEANLIPQDESLVVDEPSVTSEMTEKNLLKNENKNELFEVAEVEKADEFLAVKPFLGEVLNSIPSDYKQPKDAGSIPDANLSIRYVHGYRSFDTRNNVKWTKSGSVLYHTAALGIVLEPDRNEQSYFIRHEEDIVSLAIHPNLTIAATGQMAQAGRAKMIEIYVWNIETKEVLACLKGFHRRAVRHLRFSPNGVYLLSLGEDDDHSLAIYDWVNGKLIATGKVDRNPVTTCEFKSDSEFITCGVKHVKFWSFNGLNITSRRGLMGVGQFEPSTSAAFAFTSKTCVTGSAKGSLIVWAGNSVAKRIPAHKGQIWVLLAKGNTLFSGGQDGNLIIWTAEFKQLSSIDLSKVTRMDPGIRALDVNSTGSYVIGTKAAEIIRIHQKRSNVLIRGHSAGEVWGLCVSPNAERFATCGGDKTLRVWGVDKVAMILPLQEDGRALDWSTNGEFIAFGSLNGCIYCYNPNESLKTLSKVQSSFGKDQWIEDIKISPNNTMIAFGAHRGVSKVEVMKVNEKGDGLSKCYLINAGLTSALTHLDWDVSSTFLVVNSQAYELKFVNVLGQTVQSASGSKDIEWYTWTSVLGFPVQGIFPPFSDGTDVNYTCRSNTKKVLATGDDFSKVKLFKYPSVVKHAAAKEYRGHSSHVTKVKFSFDDRYLISTGGYDKAVIIWGTDMAVAEEENKEEEEVNEEPESEAETKEQETAYDETDTSELEKKIQEMQKEIAKRKAVAQPGNGFTEEAVEEATEFMASKPWLGALREPTGFIKPPYNQSQPPKVELSLEYIHGYRSRDCKNNISYLADGRIAYHAAAAGIVLDTPSNTQRFFIQHTDDILSIAFHPDKVRIATGELGPKPVIYIWNTTTCLPVGKFRGHLAKGIKSLSFSPNGDYLAALDMSQYHNLAIYDINNQALLAVCKTDPALVLQVAFKTETELVTVGVKHYMYWKVNNRNLSSRRGLFKKYNSIIGCVAADKDLTLTGNVLGELYQWMGNTITSVKKVHAKTLDCITIFEDLVLTGGRDAKIQIMDKALNSIMTIDTSSADFNSISPEVRSLTLNPTKSSLLVGTYGSEIYELSIDLTTNAVNSIVTLMQGHYSPCRKTTNEVWGLAAFLDNLHFATVSDDATLRIWNTETRKQERVFRFDLDAKGLQLKDPTTQEIPDSVKARSVAISPDGKFLAVGFKDGSLAVVDCTKWVIVYKRKENKSWIADIKFSPDGTFLATGAHDTLIQVYEFPKMAKKAVLKGHSSYVRHIDWSVDSRVLHSNSGDYELLFWDVESGKQVTSGATAYRDEKWATWTCVIGWPAQGIWPPCSKGTDINACDRSGLTHDTYHLLATADDFGKVNVFRYPCISKGAMAIEGKGHSSHVTNVRFGVDDKYMFSTGGNDGCVFQWNLK